MPGCGSTELSYLFIDPAQNNFHFINNNDKAGKPSGQVLSRKKLTPINSDQKQTQPNDDIAIHITKQNDIATAEIAGDRAGCVLYISINNNKK